MPRRAIALLAMTDFISPAMNPPDTALSAEHAPLPPGVLREDVLIAELLDIMRAQGRGEAECQRVMDGFTYAREKHAGQTRKNGENYIVHPVAVAIALMDLRIDVETILSAIMHDTIEDTSATPEEITQRFGEDVCRIVQGVTKLGKFEFSSAEDRAAENFRKMFLAMADDIRVVLVKLHDRLHNMRTLDAMTPEKQARIAKETLEIFAPLANRMGMGKLRIELEDLSLPYIDPDGYASLRDELEHTKAERLLTVNDVIATLSESLEKSGISAKLSGRVKNYYSLYKKMNIQQKAVSDIFDITAVRVIVGSERECYEALGIVHQAYTPMPGRFKDYIGIPKSNLYQSLHTVVIGPRGRPVEVQIRTKAMHQIAEYGIAAHWKYKEASGSQLATMSDDDLKLTFLRQMLEMDTSSDGALDYVESVKLDLFQDEVFIFTPKGRVLDLPKGSTPVDFAYRIHTEVGHKCSGAIVNGKMVTLDTILKNGDIVEVMTQSKHGPRLDWIKFVKTNNAKNRIRQWFKKNLKDEHEVQGRRLLEEQLTKAKFEELIRSDLLSTLASEMNYESVEDLFAAVGYGEISLARITNRLRKRESVDNHQEALDKLRKLSTTGHKKDAQKGEIDGLQGMLYSLAKCCSPLPGEDIVGVVTRSRGVMVHRGDCINLSHVNPARTMELDWLGAVNTNKSHSVRLELTVFDRLGVLKDILARVSDMNTNIANMRVKVERNNTAIIELTLDVTTLDHLDRVMNAIRRVPDVVSVVRQQFRTSKPMPGEMGGDWETSGDGPEA